jgi:hypothetical protein
MPPKDFAFPTLVFEEARDVILKYRLVFNMRKIDLTSQRIRNPSHPQNFALALP